MATQTISPSEATQGEQETQNPQALPMYATALPTFPTQPTPYRFTVVQYEQMIAAGVFHEDERIELIEGEIVQMGAIDIRHATCVARFDELLHASLPKSAYFIFVQNPIRTPDNSEPQPDLAVVERKDYTETPGPKDVLFVVEVADSTILTDRKTKLPLYAAAGIREAWLVDTQGRIVERHTEPVGEAYRSVVFAREGQTLDSTVLPVVRVPTAEILR